MTPNEKLAQLLTQGNIAATSKQHTQLIDYLNLIIEWNKTYNLTAITQMDEMLIKHLADSAVVLPYLHGNTFIDVGTGAGLPGVPLAILDPTKQFTLCDSLGKRIRFLVQVKKELGLNNIFPVQKRVQDYTEQKFDGVISRAFSSLQSMVTRCEHLVTEKGHFYALKGAVLQQELAELTDNIIVDEVIELTVPELNAERALIVLSKK